MKKSLSISSSHHAGEIRKFFKKTRILKTNRPAPHTDKNVQHAETVRHP
jgi:hypothetical protein